LKAGWLAFGSLMCAAPVFAQTPDPLAPLQPSPATASAQPPTVQPPAPVSPGVAVPKDWRGVFDAIDAGQWASAQAGIAALPPSIITPAARAELYTAKGSPQAVRTAMEFYEAHAAGNTARTGELLDQFFLPYIELRNRGQGYAVSIVKAGATIVGRSAGPVRPPLSDLEPGEIATLATLIESLGAQ